MSTVAVAHWTAPPLFQIAFVELVLCTKYVAVAHLLLSKITRLYGRNCLCCVSRTPTNTFLVLHTSRVSESLPPMSCARWTASGQIVAISHPTRSAPLRSAGLGMDRADNNLLAVSWGDPFLRHRSGKQ